MKIKGEIRLIILKCEFLDLMLLMVVMITDLCWQILLSNREELRPFYALKY